MERKRITTLISMAVVATLDIMEDRVAAQTMMARRIFLIRVPNTRIRKAKRRWERGTRATASEMAKDTSTKNRMWLV